MGLSTVGHVPVGREPPEHVSGSDRAPLVRVPALTDIRSEGFKGEQWFYFGRSE